MPNTFYNDLDYLPFLNKAIHRLVILRHTALCIDLNTITYAFALQGVFEYLRAILKNEITCVHQLGINLLKYSNLFVTSKQIKSPDTTCEAFSNSA